MNCNAKIFCRILSVDWQEALLAYDLGNVSFITVELTDPDGDIRSWKSEEGCGTGRLRLSDLKAASRYVGTFVSDYGTLPLDFTTLEAPQGKMTGAFALIADPHLSLKTENRKGRFMVESEMIFQDVVTQCNLLEPDFVLLPGDITNNAEPEEFRIAAGVMSQIVARYIAVPGNHDVHQQPDVDPDQLWKDSFGAKEGIFKTSVGVVVALDTARGYLTDTSAALLDQALNDEYEVPLLVITHYQLFENEKVYRGGSQKVINNADEYSSLLKRLIEVPSIIYAGHQNIPAVKAFGQALQVNLPQPTQYPCGFIYVRCYENRFYHTFKPIRSEVMRQWSRRIGELSAKQYKEIQWESDYREGQSMSETNFVATLTAIRVSV